MYKDLKTFFKVINCDKYLKKEKAGKKNWCKHSSCIISNKIEIETHE